jgi:hypothetical protein
MFNGNGNQKSLWEGDATMKTLRFGASTAPVRLQYPVGWAPASLSALTLKITDTAGVVLVAAQSVTPPAALIVKTAVGRYSQTLAIVLPTPPATLANPPVIGDRIRVAGVTGAEEASVRGYATSTGVITLDRVLANAYDAGSMIYRLQADTTINLSSATVYPAGKELLLSWIPTGTGAPWSESAIVETYYPLDVADFRDYLEALNPRVYAALTSPRDRFGEVYRAAQTQVATELAAVNLDPCRIRDGAVLKPCLRLAVLLLWADDCDDDLVEERKMWTAGYNRAFAMLKSAPIWVDGDNDLVKDADEEGPHPEYFERGW